MTRQRDLFDRYPYLLQFLSFSLISIGCLLLSANIGALLAMSIFGTTARYEAFAILWVQAFTTVGGFLMPACWLANMKKKFRPDYLHLHKTIPIRGLLWGVVAFLLLTPAVAALQEWGQSWLSGPDLSDLARYFRTRLEQSQAINQKLLQVESPALFTASLIVMAAGAGICEEFFFRGSLQNLLSEWFGNTHVAIWVSAAVFSAFHLNLPGFLPICLLGALLGYTYAWSGTLWLPILLHTANNAFIAILTFLHYNKWISFDPQSLDRNPGWSIVIPSTAALLLLFIFLGRKKRKKNCDPDKIRPKA